MQTVIMVQRTFTVVIISNDNQQTNYPFQFLQLNDIEKDDKTITIMGIINEEEE